MPFDRIAFVLLLVAVAGRAALLRENLFVFERAIWPMLGLTVFALASVAGQPFDQDAWSVLASKLVGAVRDVPHRGAHLHQRSMAAAF